MHVGKHNNEIRCAVSNFMKATLLAGVATVSLVSSACATDTYLAVWASDKETDDNHLDPDFLAIIDADPRSPHYGNVVNTAALESVADANLRRPGEYRSQYCSISGVRVTQAGSLMPPDRWCRTPQCTDHRLA